MSASVGAALYKWLQSKKCEWFINFPVLIPFSSVFLFFFFFNQLLSPPNVKTRWWNWSITSGNLLSLPNVLMGHKQEMGHQSKWNMSWNAAHWLMFRKRSDLQQLLTRHLLCRVNCLSPKLILFWNHASYQQSLLYCDSWAGRAHVKQVDGYVVTARMFESRPS